MARLYEQSMHAYSRALVTDALRRTDGHVSKAAEYLGLTRSGLQKIIRTHALQPEAEALREAARRAYKRTQRARKVHSDGRTEKSVPGKDFAPDVGVTAGENSQTDASDSTQATRGETR